MIGSCALSQNSTTLGEMDDLHDMYVSYQVHLHRTNLWYFGISPALTLQLKYSFVLVNISLTINAALVNNVYYSARTDDTTVYVRI